MVHAMAKTEQSLYHIPVMLREMLEHINPRDGGHYLDCTFGAGGYSRAILHHANCDVVGIDQDPNVIQFAEQIKNEPNVKDRFKFINNNFSNISAIDFKHKFNGIVLDLGVSSMQIDEAERGFSFQKDGTLDMRMGNDGISAEDFINNAPETQIADVIYKYSNEHKSRRVAKEIIKMRTISKIDTTFKLAEIVRGAVNRRFKSKIDPATKTFQAIRIHVNKELESLEKFCSKLKDFLLPKGVVVVVSFHSLEDGIIKSFFKKHAQKKIARSKYSKKRNLLCENEWLEILTKRPLTPSIEEVQNNVRARSAKLRAARMLGGGEL